MTSSEQLKALPHGPGFRFVDTITALEPGQSATATYLLRGDEPFLADHFPGNPMIPGVILIESLAQVGGVVSQSDPEIPPLRDLRLTAVRSAKILGTAVPGDTLEISASLAGRLGPLAQVSGAVSVAGKTILSAQVTLSGTPA